MNHKELMSSIETFIRVNGDRFKLYYLKHGMKGEMLPFRKIHEIEHEYGSLKNYIQLFLDTYTPHSIEVITKKPNGNSHGTKPQYKTFELQKDASIPNPETSIPVLQPLSLNGSGLSGVEKIYSLETTLLNRELTKETNRAERYENLYHELRDKHFNLEKDYKLLREKTELEKEKERLKNENSISSVIKEVKPELFGLLGTMMQSKANIPEQIGTLQGVEEDSIAILTGTLTQLPETMKTEAIEVLIRYLNSEAEYRGEILALLKENTPALDEQIQEILPAK